MGKFRTASIILTENCHLGKISQEIYNEFVLAEKQKSLTTELDFLTNNFFFDNIPIATFRSRYFYNFVKIEFSRGKILFKEKEFCEKLFFIKEGEIELKLESSLVDLIKLINNTILNTKCFKKSDKYLDFRGIH